jgi:hypothetical protein
MGRALLGSRSGPIAQADPTRADGHADRRAVADINHRHFAGSTHPLTPEADKGQDSADVALARR